MVNFPEGFQHATGKPFSVWLWVLAPEGYDGYTASVVREDFMGSDVLAGLDTFCTWLSRLVFQRGNELDLVSAASWIDMNMRMDELARSRLFRRNDVFCCIDQETGGDELMSMWLSRPLIAEFLLGVSDCGERWVCTYDDLTECGRRFYDLVSRYYSDYLLAIVSFGDT